MLLPENTSRPEIQGGIGFAAIQVLLYSKFSVAHIIHTDNNELSLLF